MFEDVPDPDEDDISDMDWQPSGAGPYRYVNAGDGDHEGRTQQDSREGAQHAQQSPVSPIFQGLASVVGNILGAARQPNTHTSGQQHINRGQAHTQPYSATPSGFWSETDRDERAGVRPPREGYGSSPAPASSSTGNVYVRSGGGPGFHWQVTTSHGPVHAHAVNRSVPGSLFGNSFTPGFQLGTDLDPARRQQMNFNPWGAPGFNNDMTFARPRTNPYAAPELDGTPFGALGAFGPLFASMLDPAAMRGGDAVFSQEALDRVITQLMEQHTSGSAPGPATDEAISSLPKRNINEKDLGTEHKAECSICMEEVNIGEQVTELPCHHWFHGDCIKAWLNEHDTCPHCRQGIMPKEGEGSPSRLRMPGEAPRHDQMWGQGEGTRSNPWVVPDSPTQTRTDVHRRRGSTTREPAPRPPAGEGLFNRMRNAFGGGDSSSGSGGTNS
ncbi:hypothetical protein ANO11243_024970 [Dothideomycetidae sp. 11243]|nr:hypothetical protein ANO11243_024970 [fungal sp. No.11243]